MQHKPSNLQIVLSHACSMSVQSCMWRILRLVHVGVIISWFKASEIHCRPSVWIISDLLSHRQVGFSVAGLLTRNNLPPRTWDTIFWSSFKWCLKCFLYAQAHGYVTSASASQVSQFKFFFFFYLLPLEVSALTWDSVEHPDSLMIMPWKRMASVSVETLFVYTHSVLGQLLNKAVTSP